MDRDGKQEEGRVEEEIKMELTCGPTCMGILVYIYIYIKLKNDEDGIVLILKNSSST